MAPSRSSVLVSGVARRVVRPGVVERFFVVRPGAREWRGLRVHVQVVEDAPRHGRLGDGTPADLAGAPLDSAAASRAEEPQSRG